MTIYQRMAAIFQEAGIPGFLQIWRATEAYPEIPPKYAVYIVTMEGEALAADDQEWVHEAKVWINLYGTTDVGAELGRLLAALLTDGFAIQPVRDLDDVRDGEYQYHKRIFASHYEG